MEETDTPDKYKNLKIRIRNVIKNVKNISELDDARSRIQEIRKHTFMFLRLFILETDQKIDNKFVKITDDIVLIVMKLFMKPQKRGRQFSEKNSATLKIFQDFYEKHYKHLWNEEKIDGTNLSGVLHYTTTEIVTAIENNVKCHFVEYVNRYINCCFDDDIYEQIKDLPPEIKNESKKDLKLKLKPLKEDVISLTKKRNKYYDDWFEQNINSIVPELPKNYNGTHIHYLNKEPQLYLNCMKYMNTKLIEMNKKSFNFFPLQTSNIPIHIQIDTKALIDLLFDENKGKELKNTRSNGRLLWGKIFNLDNKIFSYNNHQFDNMISTDGYSISIRFINNKYFENNEKLKDRLIVGQNKAREEYENLDRKEIEKRKDEKTEKNKKFKKSKVEKRKELKEEYKVNKNKEEKEDIKKAMKENKNIEFPYIDELQEAYLNILKNRKVLGKVVYVDPGKNNILFIMNDDGVTFRYTISERLFETKRVKYQKSLENYKYEKCMDVLEKELSDFNSKECDAKKFGEYIKTKNKVDEQLKQMYEAEIFRKYKLFAYINTQRSEAQLVQKIKKIFGNDIFVVYGDWSIGKQMRNFISTPNKKIRKLLDNNFHLCLIDEFRTSMINCKTHTKNDNIYLSDKEGVLRKMHSILTYQMENGRLGCINRDKNSVYNMKTIVECFLEFNKRPEIFCREISPNTMDPKKIINNADLNKNVKPQKKVVKTNIEKTEANGQEKIGKIKVINNVKPLMSLKEAVY